MLRSVFQEQASDAEKFIVLHAPQTLKGERERERGQRLKVYEKRCSTPTIGWYWIFQQRKMWHWIFQIKPLFKTDGKKTTLQITGKKKRKEKEKKTVE